MTTAKARTEAMTRTDLYQDNDYDGDGGGPIGWQRRRQIRGNDTGEVKGKGEAAVKDEDKTDNG